MPSYTNPSTGRVERTGIMLAFPLTPRRLLPFKGNAIAQPKLNGERGWSSSFHGEVVLTSSYGNLFTQLPHINEALQKIYKEFPDIKLDGELYRHGMRFEEIHSIASRRDKIHPDYESLQFHIFDHKDETSPQAVRTLYLQDVIKPLFPDNGILQLVPSVGINVQEIEAVNEQMVQYVAAGYEGIILRQYRAPYEETRSRALLKWKPNEKDSYLIVDMLEGEGWCKNMLGAFLVRGQDSTLFKVGSGALLTKANRIALWENRLNIIGKDLLVKHEPLTTSHGKPKCAVALEVIA